MDVKFDNNSNFNVNVSSSGRKIAVKTTTGSQDSIQVTTSSGNTIIPITTSKDTKLSVDTSSGAGYLKYIIDNELGSYLVLQDNLLQLYSKSNKLLSAVTIPKELPSTQDVKNKYLFVDSLCNLTWVTGPGEGSQYYSGAAISIGEDHKVNLMYDLNSLYINADGKIQVNFEIVQAKMSAGSNVVIENNVISAKDTTYTAGRGIKISDQNEISTDEDNSDYRYLTNKPQINGVELLGNLLGKDLKLDQIEYITYKTYRNLEVKEPKLYFVCKNTKDLEAEDCWRIYLQNKLVGEWEVESGMVTLPVFPFRFPCRFA